MAYAPLEDPVQRLLYTEPDTQRVLLYLVDKLAATSFQVATVVQLDPDRTHELLRKLEEVQLVSSRRAGLAGSGGVYRPTEAGIRAAWDLRSRKSAV